MSAAATSSPDSSLPPADPAGRLAPQRALFYQMLEQIPGLVVVLHGPEHRVEYCNPAFQRLYAGRDLLGRPVADTQPEAVRQGFVALLDEVYATGEPYQAVEVFGEIEDATGGPRKSCYYDITYQALRENGQIVGVSVLSFDVTERVLLRQQRTSQQMQLQLLFEQAPMAVAILLVPEYIIEVANPVMALLLGRPPAQLQGQPLLTALPEVRSQGVKERLDKVVLTNHPFVAHELCLEFMHGDQLKTMYFDFVYQPLHDEQGHLARIAVVATDVSEKVASRQQQAHTNKRLGEANQELARANQQLTRTNADLDTFIYTASHDLKAPISNIEGLLTALREELALPPAEADVPPLLALMQQSVERFKRTIGHLTEITKLQKFDSQPVEDIELTGLIEAVRLDLRQLQDATHAQLHVDVSRCPTIAFSEKNLRSIIYNLLSNALKYHAPGRTPRVWIRCAGRDKHTMLEVQDNGLGLTRAQQQKLFGMFRRLHDHVEGSGIGLYMVKKILDNAGARIEVVSEAGVGSTFRVYFPR